MNPNAGDLPSKDMKKQDHHQPESKSTIALRDTEKPALRALKPTQYQPVGILGTFIKPIKAVESTLALIY
jgi:hypothetical protein